MPCCATWNLLKNELWNKTPLIRKKDKHVGTKNVLNLLTQLCYANAAHMHKHILAVIVMVKMKTMKCKKESWQAQGHASNDRGRIVRLGDGKLVER